MNMDMSLNKMRSLTNKNSSKERLLHSSFYLYKLNQRHN